MATAERDTNGKFLKGNGAAIKQPNNVIAGNVTEPARSDAIGGEGIIDPAAIDGRIDADRESGESKPKRGRPAGSGKQKEKAAFHLGNDNPQIDLNSLNFTLFYAHSLIASVSGIPEVAIGEKDAETLAKAATNVMKHYNIKASQKAIDWGNLAMTALLIYGGNIHAYSKRKAQEAEARKAARAEAQAPFGLQ